MIAVRDVKVGEPYPKIARLNLFSVYDCVLSWYSIPGLFIVIAILFLYAPKPAAASDRLEVPTPVTLAATTPVFDTRLVIDTT